jgi:hypothetical protein
MGKLGKMRMEWVLERTVLRIHSCRIEGLYEDNLPWIMGVEVEQKGKTKDIRIVGFVDSRQPFPGNDTRNACWYFLMSPLRRQDSVGVRITWVYLWVQTNPHVHGYTVVALHLKSIPKGIES